MSLINLVCLLPICKTLHACSPGSPLLDLETEFLLFFMTIPRHVLHHINLHFRALSKRVFGTCYEPHSDIVVITGGASGLGHEFVCEFARQSGRVVVLDVVAPVQPVPSVTYYTCDVADRHLLHRVHQLMKQDIGSPTVLVNNAGIATGQSLLDMPYTDIERTIRINLLASFYTIKVFLPDMIALRRGYVVTVASVLGYMLPARLSAYGASKSGLIALHELLTYELGPPFANVSGVKTLLVCPGQLQTPMFNGVKTPSNLFAPELDPQYVARRVVGAILLGMRGEMRLPMYGNFIPVFRALPWPIVEIARKLSGIDQSMFSFKQSKVTECE